MNPPKFRHPSEMPLDEEREPVSARVKVSTKEALEKAAKENNRSIGSLIGHILDDYVAYLKTSKSKSKT